MPLLARLIIKRLILRSQGLKKVWISIIITVIVIGVASLVSGHAGRRGRTSKKAMAVRLEKPVKGELIEYVTCPGTIEPTKKVTIKRKGLGPDNRAALQ